MLATLRPTTPEDIDFVTRLEWAEENVSFVLPWSAAEHQRALASHDFDHLIVEAGDARVGYMILAGRASEHASIECRRIVIGPKGRGIGRAAVGAMLEMSFDRHGAHRVWLDVKTHNTRAIHVYESEGFVREGVLRECLRANGAYESLLVMSILDREFAARIRHRR
jgi:ribosomal protein S18 acetylase RimI-like enzyme